MIDRKEVHGPYVMPSAIRETLTAYKFDGRPTGGFTQAVIENDLIGAISRSDLESEAAMKEICRWVYWELPMPAAGPKGYKKWTNMGGLSGMEREVDHATALEINKP